MQQGLDRSFGPLIATVLPGFVLLAGVATRVPEIAVWMLGVGPSDPTIGGVFYVTAASTLLGMLLGALRWATIDQIFAFSGLRRPAWNDRRLIEALPAFTRLVDDHYRYYQFYSNTAIALAGAFLLWRSSPHATGHEPGWVELGLSLIVLVLLAASRDALSRYYRRTGLLLDTLKEDTDDQRKPPEANAR
ncbi:MAG: hypothetical protein AAGJ54_03670 [Planctomycetota bacterium]